MYEVIIIQQDDESSERFCCVLNAQIWLERNTKPVSSIWVTDEITGDRIRAEEAHYVSSTIITTPHTRNRIHVFAQKESAEIHARQFNGKLVTNPLRTPQKRPVKLVTYKPDSPDDTGFAPSSSQKLVCLACDAVWIRNPNDVHLSQRCSSRLPRGFTRLPDKPPKAPS
jgi:hypothetical protein